ncbi:MAG: hypothetical protein PVJ57_08485 [Phycisphaerae bacterium]|jgi:chromosome segregation ATPase
MRPIVGEIRERIDKLSGHERSQGEREAASEAAYEQLERAARDAAEQEWAAAQARLRRRSDELDAQAVDLTARAARLDELEQKLTVRQVEQEQAQREISGELQRLQRHAQAITQEHQEQRRRLRQRITKVRKRESELERRVARAHGDVVKQRQELEQQASTLRTRSTELEQYEQQLQARRTALQREMAELHARAVETQARQHGTNRSGGGGEQGGGVDEALGELENQRYTLVRRQQELDQRWRETRSERTTLARRAEEIEGRRRILQAQQATFEQRLRRLESYDQQLRARAATLQTEAQRLAEIEADMVAKRGTLDELTRQAEERLHAIEQRRAETTNLQEQAEARDAEIRQRQLSVEVERAELEQQRGTLTVAQTELRRQREEAGAELARMQEALAEKPAEATPAEAPTSVPTPVLVEPLVAPPHWQRRAAVLAVLAGLVAGYVWWRTETPVYRAMAEMALSGDSPAAQEVVEAHRRRLQRPDAVAELLGEEALTGTWAAADVNLAEGTNGPALRVSLDGPNATDVRDVVTWVATGYCEAGANMPAEPGSSAGPDLTARAAALEAERKTWQDRRQVHATQAAALATVAQRDEARETADRLREEFEALSEALVQQRGELSVLLGGPVPRGTVSPVAMATGLATDDVHNEDAKEFRANATSYRSELTVALLLVVDPLSEFQRVVRAFGTTLEEQRQLQPPAALATVLEQCAAEIAEADKTLGAARERWQTLIEGARELEPEEQIADLIRQQHTAYDETAQLAGLGRSLIEKLNGHLKELTEASDGGTRSVVVAALLRDELSKISTSLAALVEASGQTDLAKNFRLDALDRQLRGLRTRMEQREASIRQRLQFEADEKARAEHAAHVLEVQQAVEAAEQRRETLLSEFSAALDRLRSLEEEVAQRAAAELELSHCDAELARIGKDLEALAKQQALAGQTTTAPSLVLRGVTVEKIAGRNRERHAVLAGLIALVGVGGIGLLMFVRNPLRRRSAWQRRLTRLQATTDTSATPETEDKPAS